VDEPQDRELESGLQAQPGEDAPPEHRLQSP
jgi:hypothetical protein